MKKFTLMELLIVVAIFAILVSILLPSLSKARAQAELAVCMSSFSQFGKAAYLHLKDNNNKFPALPIDNNSPLRAALLGVGANGNSTGYNQFTADKRILNQYLGDFKKEDTAAVRAGIDRIFECLAGLEAGYVGCCDLDGGAGLGVATAACTAMLDGKRSEAHQGYLVAAGESLGNTVHYGVEGTARGSLG